MPPKVLGTKIGKKAKIRNQYLLSVKINKKMLLPPLSKTLTIVFFIYMSCISTSFAQKKTKPTTWKQVGMACIYSKSLEGTKTATGENIHLDKLTAAHLKIPLGSNVKVTNMKNGKSVIVKINDRGPNSKKFIIDLTPAAAKQIGFSLSEGIVQVKLEIVE